jgi:hypothetical protein
VCMCIRNMTNNIPGRIVYSVFLLLCVFLLPWWIYIPVLILPLFSYRAWESVCMAFVADALYTPSTVLYGFPVVTIGVLVCMWLLQRIRERLYTH